MCPHGARLIDNLIEPLEVSKHMDGVGPGKHRQTDRRTDGQTDRRTAWRAPGAVMEHLYNGLVTTITFHKNDIVICLFWRRSYLRSCCFVCFSCCFNLNLNCFEIRRPSLNMPPVGIYFVKKTNKQTRSHLVSRPPPPFAALVDHSAIKQHWAQRRSRRRTSAETPREERTQLVFGEGKIKHLLTSCSGWRQQLVKQWESNNKKVVFETRRRTGVSPKWQKLSDKRRRGRHAHRAPTELSSVWRSRCQYTPAASCLPALGTNRRLMEMTSNYNVLGEQDPVHPFKIKCRLNAGYTARVEWGEALNQKANIDILHLHVFLFSLIFSLLYQLSAWRSYITATKLKSKFSTQFI